MAPTVTVAIPLHGSAPWVDNVVANVRALPAMVTEILISDQTCLDDAADRLRIRLADDPRVTVLAEAAGLGFAAHYQLLLETAGGELFMWMPHDDIFDPGWVPILAAALASHPQAWLAFGQLRFVHIDGVTPMARRRFPFRPGQISGAAAVRMMAGGWAGFAFRGLFRRHEVLTAGLRMEPGTTMLAVDTDWVFRVALRSALVYDDRVITWKRAYPGSTSTTPSWRSQRRGDERQAAVALLLRHGPGGPTGFAMRTLARVTGLPARSRARIARVVPSWAKPTIRTCLNWLTSR